MNKNLVRLIREMIKASPSYMKLEDDRELIQRNIVARVRRGVIKDDRDLRAYLNSIWTDPLTGKKSKSYELAVTALSDIPFSVWEKVS